MPKSGMDSERGRTYLMITVAPGVVAGDADISMPANTPPIAEVLQAQTIELTEAAPNTLVVQALTPEAYDGTCSANAIQRKNYNTVIIANPTTTSTLLTLVVKLASKGFKG